MLFSELLKRPATINSLRIAIVALSGYLLQMIPDHIYRIVGESLGYKVLLILLLLSILITLLVSIKNRHEKINKSESIPDNLEKPQLDSLECSKPTPNEIYDEIYKQPPLLRDQFAKNYIGLMIKWTGTFYYAESEGNDNIEITIFSDNQFVYTMSSLKDYPIFKTLQPKSVRLQVSGIITSVDAGITLGKAEIVFLDEKIISK
jgi:hypothetical protein